METQPCQVPLWWAPFPAAVSESALPMAQSSPSPCSRDVGAAGTAQSPGQQDTEGLEMVEAAWVVPWSPAPFTWAEAGCAHLQWGYLSAFITAEINGWEELMVFPEMDLVFSLILSCLWWSSQGVFWAGTYTHTQSFHVWPHFPKIRPESAAIYKRLDIKSINVTLHSYKSSHPVIFPFSQERCGNYEHSEAEVHVQAGALLIIALEVAVLVVGFIRETHVP